MMKCSSRDFSPRMCCSCICTIGEGDPVSCGRVSLPYYVFPPERTAKKFYVYFAGILARNNGSKIVLT